MYEGIQPHCVLCSTYDYFRHNPNSSMPFGCASGMMSLNCAARVDNQGYKMQTLPKCKYYKPQRGRKIFWASWLQHSWNKNNGGVVMTMNLQDLMIKITYSDGVPIKRCHRKTE